jgi:hypothetical protein
MKKMIEDKKSPVIYSYEVYNIKGKKHIRFNSEVAYPLETLDFILKRVKEEKIQRNIVLVGMGLVIPARPHLTKRLKNQTINSSWSKNGQKRTR